MLRLFEDDRQTLTLTDVVQKTGMERTICFRVLHTLLEEGLLRRSERHKYAANFRLLSEQRFRIGYASQGHDSFCMALGQGMRWAARQHQVDLLELDNQYSPKTALRNAESLIKQGVDLAIEFQIHDRMGRKLSELFSEAGIPVIAIEIPQPGAVFYGVDNHKVGMIAGKTLLQAAQRDWNGEFDELLLLDLEVAGSLPHMRVSSAQGVLRRNNPGSWVTTHLESRGEFLRAFELTRKHLQNNARRRTLLTGVNDYAVLGALRAFEEAGRANLCLAVGLGGIPEGRRELRLPNTRLVASVAFFPERYGESAIALALDLLQAKTVPPALYAPVQLLTPRNLDQFYPKDLYRQSDLDELAR